MPISPAQAPRKKATGRGKKTAGANRNKEDNKDEPKKETDAQKAKREKKEQDQKRKDEEKSLQENLRKHVRPATQARTCNACRDFNSNNNKQNLPLLADFARPCRS